MLFFRFLLSLLPLFVSAATNSSSPVSWDKYSLSINGERLFVYSGEFHYVRLPVPELWLDIFQKLRANGFNAASVYFFWSFHSASEGVFDFETGAHNLQRLFDYAKEAGVYIIARPGPYINAETSAGGFAIWAANGQMGEERTSDPAYYERWAPWMQQVGKILAANQISEGGPVILVQHENELQEYDHSPDNTLVIYMEQISEVLADAGIVVPSTSNEKGMRSQSWSTDYEDVGGAVNVYGLDSYPGGLSCTNPDSGFYLIRTYYEWFQNYSYTQPEYVPEFEGGWFSSWGGTFYDDCIGYLVTDYPDVFYKNNVGSRITLQSLYMTYGGTNWGHMAAPVVYTSYDYDAPLRETREIRDKMKQTKLLGLFARVSSDLLQTEMEGNGTGYANDTSIFTWSLRNPTTNAGFYVVQHDDSRSQDNVVFDLTVETSAGSIDIPSIGLNGRQSKIITTDYTVGDTTFLYISADVLTYATLDVDVVALYLETGQTGTFAFANTSLTNLTYKIYGNSPVTTSQASYGNMYSYTQGEGTSVIQFSNGLLVYLLDTSTAWDFFAPTLVSNPIVKPDQHIFVIGPYLVREAVFRGDTLELTGDNANTTSIEVYHGNPSVTKVRWNHKMIDTKCTEYGSLIGTISGAEDISISLPTLSSWQSHDTIPEINPEYDDSRWVVCNKSTTVNAIAPLSLPVLYSGDYGYGPGPKVYRGRFGNVNATSVSITAQNGYAAGWSAWLNGEYLGGSIGEVDIEATNAVLEFNSSILSDTTENVLTVLVDYTGHDEANVRPEGAQNPRGLLGAILYSGSSTVNFTSWKIQGNAGGEKNIDPLRGPMNEGGLYGERMGWHLPGFDPSWSPSGWDHSTPFDGVDGGSGRFYITDFTFDLKEHGNSLDVPIGIKLNASSTSGPAVVYVWLNGYNYAHYLPQFGPQTVFPFQPGILNIKGHHSKGTNRLALSLWALTDEPVALDEVELVTYGVYTSSFDFARDWSYLQPGWTNRSEYA